MTTSISITEGRIGRAQKNQEIDYHHLNSCFTITAELSNGEKIGAHFALKGKEADGGRDPKDLFFIFSKVIEQANRLDTPPVNISLIGFLCYWYPSNLGLKQSQEGTLSQIHSQRALAESLHVPLEKIQVKDTSLKDHVYLSIAADGSPVFYEKEDGKDKRDSS